LCDSACVEEIRPCLSPNITYVNGPKPSARFRILFITMARLEMPIIFKALGDAGVRTALKRHCLRLLENNHIIFDIKNLGVRRLPQVFRRNGERQFEGHYFLLNIDGPEESMQKIKLLVTKDYDVIKCNVCRIDDGWCPPCQVVGAAQCEFGEIRNPNYEKTSRTRHGFRAF
uniref:Small ribosomal subunit protein bS6m n=1 Tax=Schistocephalus solidus TaxID=70667 RepID=A0A183T109_SCHSO